MIFTVTVLILLIIVVLCIIVQFFFNQVVTRKPYPYDETYEDQSSRGLFNKEEYEKLSKEEVSIKTFDGLKLKGVYIEGDKSLNRTMIFVHGITVNIGCSIKYIDMFVKKGWSILMYDQRRHGSSEGKYTTYGYLEKDDLDRWVNWVIERNGGYVIIGLHGESMGAGTVLQYAKISKHVKFIIADCAYSNLNELLTYHIKNDFHIPAVPIIPMTSLMAKLRAGFRFKDVSPIDDIRDVDIPIMFAHGKADKFVPFYMSEKMYEAKKGMKKFHVTENAEHACSIEVDRESYEKAVMEFVEEALKQ